MKDRSSSKGPSRRSLLGGVAALSAMAGVSPSASAQVPALPNADAAGASFAPQALKGAQGTKLVLLGTGAGPTLGQQRHMTSHILVSNGASYVVDCGMTAANRIAEAGVALNSIRDVFITHHHPDHNSEYGPLLLMAWINGRYDEINSYGPPPISQITKDYLSSIEWTVDLYIKDFQVPPFPKIKAHDLPKPGPVMQDENVKVTSTLVQHPPIVPAYGYRFDFKDRSIAFSGDTVPVDAMVQLAKGADVLVHEAMMFDRIKADMLNRAHSEQNMTHANVDVLLQHMLRCHSPVEEVGRIAAEAGVKTLVLSHLTPGRDLPVIDDEEWRSRAAKYFKGEIVVAHDLMVV